MNTESFWDRNGTWQDMMPVIGAVRSFSKPSTDNMSKIGNIWNIIKYFL